jgi:hypothetical protein
MAELFSLMLLAALCTMECMEQEMPDGSNPIQPAPAAPERRTISARKLAANQRNARHSTGPRTARGKARSAMNSLRHGLRARSLVVPRLEGRNAAAQFAAMMTAIVADREPIGAIELLLVERIAACEWRMRRLLKYENRAAFLESRRWIEPPPEFNAYTDTPIGPDQQVHMDENARILAETGLNKLSLPYLEDLPAISKYESALMRHLFRAIEQLDRMQRRRRAEAANRDPENPDRSDGSSEILQHRGGV